MRNCKRLSCFVRQTVCVKNNSILCSSNTSLVLEFAGKQPMLILAMVVLRWSEFVTVVNYKYFIIYILFEILP